MAPHFLRGLIYLPRTKKSKLISTPQHHIQRWPLSDEQYTRLMAFYQKLGLPALIKLKAERRIGEMSEPDRNALLERINATQSLDQ